MSGMRDRIVGAMKTYYQLNGKPPTRVHLELEDEWDILKDERGVPADMQRACFLKGFRAAIREASDVCDKPTLFGLQIVWDAKQFEVDRPEDDDKTKIKTMTTL